MTHRTWVSYYTVNLQLPWDNNNIEGKMTEHEKPSCLLVNYLLMQKRESLHTTLNPNINLVLSQIW